MEIKVNEIRIGNYLKWTSGTNSSGISRVEFINSRENSAYMKTFQLESGAISNQCSPIPITEDVLRKLHFSKDVYGNFCYDMIYLDKITMHICIYDRTQDEWFEIPKKIKYVHELQNMYFCLTGRELECSGF